MKIRRRTSYALGVLTTVAALFLVGYVSAALYTTVDFGSSSGADITGRYIGTNRLDFNGTTVSSITNDGVNQTVFNAAGVVFPSGVGVNITSTPRMNAIGELTAAAGVTVDGMLIKDGAILETVITDGAVLARVGSAETISGVWAFTALPQVNGGAFASVANITTHAALTSTHGVSGAIVGTTDTQALSAKTLAGATMSGVLNLGDYSIINAIVIYDGAASALQSYIEFVSNTSLDIYTYQDGVANALKRVSFGAGATATVAWSNAVQTGIVLGGNLAVDGNNTRTLFTSTVRGSDIYLVNAHVLAGVTTGGLFEGKMKPVSGYIPQNGDVVVLVNGTHYARSNRVGETRPTTAVFINTIQTSESVDVVKTFTETVMIDVVKRENVTVIDVFGKKHIEVKEDTVRTAVTDRVWKNRTIKNERGESETITVFADVPRTINVTKAVKETVTRDTFEAVLYIWEPNALVKVCGVVKAGDRLIAGENGCARTWGDLIAQKNPMTIEALIDFMSRYSSFGVANEDSKDGYVRATVTVR